jgi:hypothetical protein
MTKLLVALVALSIVGCRRTEDVSVRAACENVIAQCGANAKEHGVKLTTTEVPKCIGDFEMQKSALGDDYVPTVSCMTSATTCDAVIECIPWPESK